MAKNRLRLEEQLVLLQEKGKSTPISIGEILHILSRQGQVLVILFFTLPFCLPLQIPGLSTPFGLMIAFIGLKLVFGSEAWLPKKLLAKTLAPATLRKITEKALWLLQKMQRWVRPRLIGLCYHPAFRIVNGLLIIVLGLLLALPLPIFFSNLLAAWPIFFMALGLLKDDGLLILISYTFSLFTFAFFIFIILLPKIVF